MKVKIFAVVVVLAVFVQGVGFAKGIIEEREERTDFDDYDTLVEQVNAYIDTGDYAATIPLLKRMHELKPGEMILVEYLGIFYSNLPEERPEFTNALFWLLEAEKRGSSDKNIYYSLACIYSLKGELEKAETAINKTITVGWTNFEWMSHDDDLVNFRTSPWWEGIAGNYTLIEQLLVEFNEFAYGEEEESITDRITFYSGIVTALKELAPHIPAMQSRPLFFLASSYQDMGDYAKAESCYLEDKAITEKVLGKEHPDYATTLNDLGGLYDRMGDYAKAESCYLEARAIREKVFGKEHPIYATTLNDLGGLYDSMGDYAKAESCYLEAKAISEKVLGKEHPFYATTLNDLGGLYYRMGDYAKAESCYLEARAIREKVFGKEHLSYATTLNNLGALYDKTGDYAKVESCYLEAKAINEKILGKEHPDYATTVNNLGALYYRMGDYAKAESYLLEAGAIREKVLGKEHPYYATTINNLGVLYRSMGDYAKAESCHLEAIPIYEKVLGKENPSYAVSLDNLYKLYLSKKEYSQALTYKQEQISINTGLVNQNFSFQTEQQRDAYWKDNSGAFEASYSLSFYHPVPASNVLNYDNALFSKGLLLRTTNAVRDSIYVSGNQVLITQFEELGRIRQQISVLRQSGGNETYIQSLETQAEALDKSLTQSSAAFRELQADLARNWQDVQTSLQPNEAAIEFVSFKIFDKKWTDTTQYAALILCPGMDAPEWVPLCEESTLTELFSKLNGKSPQEQAHTLYDEYGPALYNAIWKPLEKTLEDVTTVYYSPSGLLHKVSFSAIPVNADSRLMDVFDLNMVSSTREVVYRNAKTAGKPNSAVVYGGLDYNVDAVTMQREALAYNVPETGVRISSAPPTEGRRGGSWNYLMWTNEESRNVQRLLEDNKIPVTLYNGAKGNKESFKSLSAKKIPVIHVATHGFFIQDIEKNYEERERLQRFGGGQKVFENPLLRSGLILAGGNNAWAGNPVEGVENGILFADDVAKMNLVGTELVVLSACETGLGDVNNSEGVFGLQRAFKLAGAQTLIMSLWEVDDRGTGVMMNYFYRNWLSGMSKQDAFKEAQRMMKTEPRYASPYYWAAFVMMD
jgi:CHAT domain-containing protein/Flp pilus assembly protein TadD